MFNLSRYFSTVSFILIVLAAGGLGLLYRQLSLSQMTELAEGRNVAMAQIFENSLSASVEQLITSSVGRDAETVRQSEEVTALRASVQNLMHRTAVVKVKIYSRTGITIFSTDLAQIGESKHDNTGFRQAIAGHVVSELTRRDSFDAFEGNLAEVDLISSYIPIAGNDQIAAGVFELYQDVTPFTTQLQRRLWWVMGGVFGVCAILYLMQFLVVRRAQRILKYQEGRIEAARNTLEIQVEGRTEELKRANRQLEGEIAERRQAESKLNYLAYHDPLTGLANRRYFIERLGQSMGQTNQGDLRIAVLFIDLDQFKQINDSLGHAVGDELLVAVAARLSELVRLVDMLARLGGDEFICVMEGVRDDEDVGMLAQEIIAAFDQPFSVSGHELFLSASIGISLFPDDSQSVVDLMRNADTAMYRAKGVGRGQYRFYTPMMTREAQERIRMENLLRRALDNNEMAIHFQPQVDARTGKLVGAEALARWDSPDLGSVSPTRFIPLAEDSGHILVLGNWVLEQACRQFMHWRDIGLKLQQISVNLSVRQLERAEFFDTLEEILSETGMEPSQLKLEITESVVMAVADSFDVLERLRKLGVTLSLDDFGTGYSSLSYLKLLPVQQLKIDRSFITGIGINPGDEAIIRSIMALAGSLDFEVVAEGVETIEQSEFLARHDCHRLQGFLYGRPIAAEEFRSRWLARS